MQEEHKLWTSTILYFAGVAFLSWYIQRTANRIGHLILTTNLELSQIPLSTEVQIWITLIWLLGIMTGILIIMGAVNASKIIQRFMLRKVGVKAKKK